MFKQLDFLNTDNNRILRKHSISEEIIFFFRIIIVLQKRERAAKFRHQYLKGLSQRLEILIISRCFPYE